MSETMHEVTEFEQVKDLDDTYLLHTYNRLPVELVRGGGAVLYDAQGREYLDFLGGIACASLGHAHPALVAALSEQAGKLWQVGNYFHIENRGELAFELSKLLATTTDTAGRITGTTGETWRTFFANSGAEANEGAIKLARRWGETHLDGATGIITARKSFHGRTLATLAACGQDVFHAKFNPMPEGFRYVPLNDIAALEEAVSAGGVCAVMLECIQGEGGVWPATREYLKAVERMCHERGLLVLIDEVQTGFFRTGAPFGFQRAGIVPDVVSMAKGIASGFPLGAFAAHGEVAELLVPGDHGSTFGGNALAAAVGLAAVRTMQAENIGEHVRKLGEYLAAGLSALPHVTEVRGAGLMLGAQFDAPIATALVERALEKGVILNHIGDSILRFIPPLVVTGEQVDEMCKRLATLIDELV